MMGPDQILDAANRAYHDRRLDDWRAWHSLLYVMGLLAVDSKLVAITELEQQARERLALRRLRRTEQDDVQFDYEREAESRGVTIRELLR